MSGRTLDVAATRMSATKPRRSRRRRPWAVLFRATMAVGRTKVGLGLFLAILTVALVGPHVAPYSPTEFVGGPFEMPSSKALLGTDILGRDVLSRAFNGGTSVFGLSIAATAIGMLLGVGLGMTAAYSSKWGDEMIMRSLDVVMAFPMIVLTMLLVSMVGPLPWLIVLAVGIGHAPRVARVARGAALGIVGLDFVKAAEAHGASAPRVLMGEVLPNIMSPMLVEAGLRFAYSIAAIASLSFIGLGLQPPSADWGLMVNENRIGVAAQPYSVLAPIVLIALLSIGICLMADGLSRALLGIDRKMEA